jgi:hypothetical protein
MISPVVLTNPILRIISLKANFIAGINARPPKDGKVKDTVNSVFSDFISTFGLNLSLLISKIAVQP